MVLIIAPARGALKSRGGYNSNIIKQLHFFRLFFFFNNNFRIRLFLTFLIFCPNLGLVFL